MPAIQRRICRALLLSMMLLMVLLLTIGGSGRIILRRRGDLLVLVLRAGRRAEGNLGRGCLLLMMLMLSRGRDGQRSRGRSVGGLRRTWASAASGARPTTSPLLAGTRSVSGFIFSFILIFLGNGGCTADGQPTGDVVRTWAWHAHRPRSTTDGRSDRHGRGEGAMRGIEACLNEIFAFRLGDQGLELGGSEGVDETCLRHNKQQDLGAGERRQLVSLWGK